MYKTYLLININLTHFTKKINRNPLKISGYSRKMFAFKKFKVINEMYEMHNIHKKMYKYP